MPALALIGIPRPRWLPPILLPLFLLWPFVPVCLGIARLLGRDRPVEAAKLRTAMQVFRELRGLTIDTDTADHKRVRIRFV
ncbi:MAG: hypothetical protein GTO29_08555 [Candidatus Latescibacteria bacterium]|nr:hypothetical protein [Candidatus Latescibacterota bacterium]NIO56214.1 hypothetical protein [Candidatus Latescibacterota bacterium]